MTSEEQLSVPSLPHLPAVRFRRYADVSDLRRICELFNRCLAADGIDTVFDFDGFADDYLKSDRINPAEHVLLAETDDDLVAFSRIKHFQQVDGDYIFHSLGHVDPGWRGHGIGSALLRYHEAQRRTMALRTPTAGAQWLETFAYDSQASTRALLARHGYEPVPEQEVATLVRPTLDDLPDAPLPQGLEVRPAEPAHRRAAWDLLQAASAEDPTYAPRTENDFAVWANQAIWDDSLWRLAFDGDRLVGMVLSFIVPQENTAFNRLRGYTEYVNVSREWRRRGVARALLVQGMQALRERGMTEAALDVLVLNQAGARRVYESIGYRRVHSTHMYRKPMTSPGH